MKLPSLPFYNQINTICEGKAVKAEACKYVCVCVYICMYIRHQIFSGPHYVLRGTKKWVDLENENFLYKNQIKKAIHHCVPA